MKTDGKTKMNKEQEQFYALAAQEIASKCPAGARRLICTVREDEWK